LAREHFNPAPDLARTESTTPATDLDCRRSFPPREPRRKVEVLSRETPVVTETHWPTLRGERIRYGDGTWELTGDVTLREDGELLALAARRTGDVRRERATLYFDVEESGESLNPGALTDCTADLDRTGGRRRLLVGTGRRTYRYGLVRLQFA
jgi:hypothetical protein